MIVWGESSFVVCLFFCCLLSKTCCFFVKLLYMANVVVPHFIDKDAVFEMSKFIQHVRDYMEENRYLRANGQLELESPEKKCVHVSARVILSDNSLSTFQNLVQLLSSYTKWQRVDNWKEEICYHYTTTEGTKVMCISETDNLKNMCTDQVEQSKNISIHPIHTITHVCTDATNVALRFMAEEHQNIDMTSATCVLPECVEMQYKRYFYLNNWKFCLMKCWRANTLVEAQSKIMDNVLPKHVIVISCIDLPTYMCRNNNYYVGLSILLKVTSLFLHECRVNIKHVVTPTATCES